MKVMEEDQLQQLVKELLLKFCNSKLKSCGNVSVRGKLDFCFSEGYKVSVSVDTKTQNKVSVSVDTKTPNLRLSKGSIHLDKQLVVSLRRHDIKVEPPDTESELPPSSSVSSSRGLKSGLKSSPTEKGTTESPPQLSTRSGREKKMTPKAREMAAAREKHKRKRSKISEKEETRPRGKRQKAEVELSEGEVELSEGEVEFSEGEIHYGDAPEIDDDVDDPDFIPTKIPVKSSAVSIEPTKSPAKSIKIIENPQKTVTKPRTEEKDAANKSDDVADYSPETESGKSPLGESQEIANIKTEIGEKVKVKTEKTRIKIEKKPDSHGPKTCEICQKIYRHPSHMKIHQTEREMHECDLCEKKFMKKANLTEHYLTHTDPDKMKCKTCGVMLQTKYALKIHEQTHEKDTKFMCEVCGKCLYNEQGLVEHVRGHTGDRPFKCSECPKDYPSRTALRKHMITHRETREHICDFCGKSFHYRQALLGHVYKLHMRRDKPYKCTQCDKAFTEKRFLDKHVKNHEANLTCERCGKTLLNIAYYNTHIKTCGTYNCEFCSRVCPSRSALEVHQLTHTKQRPFSCQFCQKTYQTKFQVTEHERRHTGETPFPCDVCGQSFISKNKLLAHKARKHAAPTFKCDLCEKLFYTHESKKSHMFSHTQDKRYTCHVCHSAFTYYSTYARHKKKHTAEDVQMTSQGHMLEETVLTTSEGDITTADITTADITTALSAQNIITTLPSDVNTVIITTIDNEETFIQTHVIQEETVNTVQ